MKIENKDTLERQIEKEMKMIMKLNHKFKLNKTNKTNKNWRFIYPSKIRKLYGLPSTDPPDHTHPL